MATPSLQSLERGLAVLRSISRTGGSGIDPLSVELGLTRGTTYRLLETLRRAGYVTRAERGLYVLAARAAALSDGYRAYAWLTPAVQTVVADLSRITGLPALIACPEGADMVVRHAVAGADETAPCARRGMSRSLLRSAYGRAFLANCDTQTQQRLLRLTAGTPVPRDTTEESERLDLLLAKIRARGYALFNVGHGEGQIAVPIFDHSAAVGALSLSYARGEMPARAACARYLGVLHHAAKTISRTLAPERRTA